MNAISDNALKALVGEIDFDPDQLREKYRQERDRRIPKTSQNQWVEVKGDFAHYVDDPYVTPGFTRDALTEDVEVLIVGGGFGGLIMGANLRKAGVENIRIIEKAGDFGGTWYWNRYPGAQCDIDSYIYMPLLEETGYMPTEKYAMAPEIYEHAQRIGRHFDLYRAACFQTQIKDMRWDESAHRWIVRTDRNDTFRARYVVTSSGPMSRPKLPGIPGIDSYKGHSFHTSRWDYEYTGGTNAGNLSRLKDKRVAIIGTGATSLQVVPHLGEAAKHLYVFQRTPTSVDARNNRPTDPEWVKTLTPGWQRRRMDNFNALVNGGFAEVDEINDGWTTLSRALGPLFSRAASGPVDPAVMDLVFEILDFKDMNRIRARTDEIVKDPATADKLKAWYRKLCKRPGFHDTYLQTFNRPNVTLVDTEGRGVDRITERGLVFNGVEYEVDCIIFATGFEIGTAFTRRVGYETYGRNGVTLSEYWKGGMRTLHGFYCHGFPNMFHLGYTQNAISPNFVHVLTDQAIHISEVLVEAKSRNATVIEPTAEAEAAWVQTIREKALDKMKFVEECTPGYYNADGRKGSGEGFFDQQYGPGPIECFALIEAWRRNGMVGLEMR
jgi:cation diffusion facilitator CzcD-associated flavoprotein CzcO